MRRFIWGRSAWLTVWALTMMGCGGSGGGPAPTDGGPDTGSDQNIGDAEPSDGQPDWLAPDLGSETQPTDLYPDQGPSPDGAADVDAAETRPDVSADMPSDLGSEWSHEVWPDSTPDQQPSEGLDGASDVPSDTQPDDQPDFITPDVHSDLAPDNDLTPANPCEPDNPCNSPPEDSFCDAADGRILHSWQERGVCHPGVDGEPVCEYLPLIIHCDDSGGWCDAAQCVSAQNPLAAGQVLITEIMRDSNDANDVGEWIELHNMTDQDWQLNGCQLHDSVQQQSHMISAAGPLTLASGGYIVLAQSNDLQHNGGLAPDYAYGPDFRLDNEIDSIQLLCNGLLIDAVEYDLDSLWPNLTGYALSLDPTSFDADLNDVAENWCAAAENIEYGTDGNHGTPGMPNPACPTPVDTTVDWCRLQWPLEHAGLTGSSLMIYGRVSETGLTGQTAGCDGFAELAGQVGFGPRNSDPNDPQWQWLDADCNPSWADGVEPGVDEYMADLTLAGPGDYDFAYRFHRNDGDWLYCDRDTGLPGGDGSTDGYAAQNAGKLSVFANPCLPDNPCTTLPEAPQCDASGLLQRTWTLPGLCTANASGQPECDYEPLTINCLQTNQVCAEGACVDAASPDEPGQIVITEVMRDPVGIADADGEWLELYNPTDDVLYLDGCTLSDLSMPIADSVTIDLAAGLLGIEPGGYLVLVANLDEEANGGVQGDYEYDAAAFPLENGSDEIILTCNGVVIDQVAYTSAPAWPGNAGFAMNLDDDAYDALLNDELANWCNAQASYDANNFGTPGMDNPSCDLTIDWCRLQWPTEIEAVPSMETTVYGRLYIAGLTDQSVGNDGALLVRGQLGVGPDNTNPGTVPDAWTWTDAEPNPFWDGSVAVPFPEPDNDEYQAVLVAPPADGDFDFAYRFSGDGGVTWVYCDADARPAGGDGSADGYQVAHAGALAVTSQVDPCDLVTCDAPPAPTCDGGIQVTYQTQGTCENVGGLPECTYAIDEQIDCSLASGGPYCNFGECTSWRLAGVGDLVITEVMNNPQSVNDEFGEWFEVFSLASGSVNLRGLYFKDLGETQFFTVDRDVVLQPGQYAVFGINDNPTTNAGVTVDYKYGNYYLGNGADAIIMMRDNVKVDDVVWDGGPLYPDPTGASMTLDPAAFDVDLNDLGYNWCEASSVYGTGVERGTPGTDNDSCHVVTYTVDWCRLQWPTTITVPGGQSTIVYGRLYIEGLTDLSTLDDEAPGIVLGQVGWGANGSSPEANPDLWHWSTAVPNAGWDGASAVPVPEPDNDEYQATLIAPSDAGSYDFAYRFSGDGGATWTYCDRDARPEGGDGSADGYQIDNAGALVAGSTIENPPNGGFEQWNDPPTLPTFWAADSGILVERESTLRHGGLYSVKLTRNAIENANTDFTSGVVPVLIGQQYTISMWFYDNDPNGRGRLIYQWLDTNQVALGNPSYQAYTVDSSNWQSLTQVVTVPSGAAYMKVSTRVYAPQGQTFAGGVVYLDDVAVAP